MKQNKKYWLGTFLWMIIIFYFSHQPNLRSSFSDFWDLILRKIVHMGEFGILNVFLIKSLANFKISLEKRIFLAVLFSFLYACSDEYHQSFIEGRVGSFRDILIDSGGILLVAFYYWKRYEDLPY